MQQYRNLLEWQQARKAFNPNASIGFIPTMGNLHMGHDSLMQASLKQNDYTVASLFINPTQFNNTEDFTHYPRTLDADLHRLEQLGVTHCLIPSYEALYPDNYHYQITENNISLMLEGVHRPGHFTGVLTVVMKLLQLVRPTHAYFGEKDYQQLQLIRNMAEAFFLNTTIVSCPTIREASGLAYSSRNSRLSPSEREIADKFAQIFHQKHLSDDAIITSLQEVNINVEYLTTIQKRRLTAVYVGDIRLIDNYEHDG